MTIGRSKLSRLVRCILPLAITGFVLSILLRAFGIVINPTHSAPQGLYVRTSQNPSYVEFCPDQQWDYFKQNPNYRAKYIANCPDGFHALLKPIAARAGDTVTVTSLGIAINGSVVRNSKPLAQDSDGRLLHPYPAGNYHVSQGELWLVSSYSPRSFDSRYFGPIPEYCVRAWLKPLLVFEH